MQVSSLHIYPIKSCAGTAMRACQVGKYGLEGDRTFMVVNPDGRFLTQRELPRMALIAPQLVPDHVRLSAPGTPDLSMPILRTGAPQTVQIWRNSVQAIDQGDAVAAWLSEFLQTSVRLVGAAPDFTRPLNPQYAPRLTDETTFADGYPVLLIAQASLDALNERLIERGHEPLPMNRFRPNIVVSGSTPFAEDDWQRIRLGDVTFDVVKPCPRCPIPAINQDTGISDGKEPLATLATFRTHELGVIFGQNLVHANQGLVKVGDRIEN
jgi:uncharacterized protein